MKENENLKSKSPSKKLIGIGVIGVIMIGAIFGIIYYDNNYKAASTVVLDINPSVELQVNKKDKVVGVVALNQDGKNILNDVDVNDSNIKDAVNVLVDKMLKNGYISADSNSVLVSVKGSDEEKSANIKNEITNEIKENLKAKEIDVSILAQTLDDDDYIEDLADKYDISEGKATLIHQIVKSNMKDHKGNAYTFENLAKLSVNELNLLLSAKQVVLDDITATGKVSENAYIGEEKAKDIALSKAKISEAKAKNLEVELDSNVDKLVYEVEFEVGTIEYEYEIDAESGTILKEVKDDNKDDINDDDKDDDKDDINDDDKDDDKDDINDDDKDDNKDDINDDDKDDDKDDINDDDKDDDKDDINDDDKDDDKDDINDDDKDDDDDDKDND